MNLAQTVAALRRRKLVQTLVVYAGASWGILQVLSFFVSTYGWSRSVIDAALFVLACGLVAALTIAWFHGEKGHQRVTRPEIAILTVVLLLALTGGFGLARRDVGGLADADTALSEGRLAVLPFENRTGDPSLAWMERGLAEMLATDLGQLPKLRVVSGERVLDLIRQEGQAQAGVVPEPVAISVARHADAAKLVRGYLYRAGGRLRLDVKLVGVGSGLESMQVKAEGTDVFPLIDDVAAQLAARLKAATGGAAAPAAALADVTTGNVDAYREYQLGLDAERNVRWGDALPHFRRAVELDSTFAQALLHLGLTENATGEFRQALDHLAAAQRNLTHASERDRLFTEAMLAGYKGNVPEAERRLEHLTRAYPDEKYAWVILAGLYDTDPATRARVEPLARQVLKLDPYYAPVYNLLAYNLARLGRYAQADSFATRYVALAPKEPNPYDTRGDVRRLAGRYADARSDYLAVLRLRPDFDGTIDKVARNAERSGRLDEARADLSAFTRSENPGVRVAALGAIEETYLWQGRVDDALRTDQQAYDGTADADERAHRAALLQLAAVWGLVGEHARAVEALGPLARGGGASVIFPYLNALGHLRRFDEMEAVRREVAAWAARPGMAEFVAPAVHEVEGYIAFYHGDWVRTIAEFRAARARTPAQPYRFELLALVNTGRAAEALALMPVRGPLSYLPARQVNSDLYLRGRILEALGRRAEAAAAYRQLVANWGPALHRMPDYKDAPARLARLGG